MEITCAQMDVLITFYAEDGLSDVLKSKVEEHLNQCLSCRAKYDIIKSMFVDLREIFAEKGSAYREEHFSSSSISPLFQHNLSAYIDNELTASESMKIKKLAINNKNARRELENTCSIRKLMNEAFRKTANNVKYDFSKLVIRQINPDLKYGLSSISMPKAAALFIITVLVISAAVILSLS